MIIATAILALFAQSIELPASYRAVRVARARFAKDPSPASRKALGIAYYAAGQHLLFREAMEAVIAADPKDFQPHYLLGRHYDSDVEDFGRAAAFFRAAIERNPNYGPSHAYLGHALELSGDASAAGSYERAIQFNACEPAALAGLARLNRASIAQLERCPLKDGMLLQALARLLTAAGRNSEAASRLASALAQDPNNAPLAYQLHRAYGAAGETAKAAEALANYKRIHAIYGGR